MGFITKDNEKDTEGVKLEYDENNVLHLEEIPDSDFDMKVTFVNEKYYKYVTKMVRATIEYKDYIQFLKHNLDIDHCSFYEGYSMKGGFTIELHHAPFTLYDYVETCCTKSMDHHGWCETFRIVEEVAMLHFRFMVGLTPLSPTCHKLVHSDVLPVHPKLVIGDWKGFYGEYAPYCSEAVVKKYNDALAMENKTDDPDIPKILEYAPTEIKLPTPRLTSEDLNTLVIESKLKLIDKL